VALITSGFRLLCSCAKLPFDAASSKRRLLLCPILSHHCCPINKKLIFGNMLLIKRESHERLYKKVTVLEDALYITKPYRTAADIGCHCFLKATTWPSTTDSTLRLKYDINFVALSTNESVPTKNRPRISRAQTG
jgi:hypothetical protein